MTTGDVSVDAVYVAPFVKPAVTVEEIEYEIRRERMNRSDFTVIRKGLEEEINDTPEENPRHAELKELLVQLPSDREMIEKIQSLKLQLSVLKRDGFEDVTWFHKTSSKLYS
jgi:hypothetical protein